MFFGAAFPNFTSFMFLKGKSKLKEIYIGHDHFYSVFTYLVDSRDSIWTAGKTVT